LYLGSFVSTKLTLTVFGLAELQAPPPPVHAAEPIVTTPVDAVVLTVCVPEQFVPRVAPLHV
jgi:hypothetical protein